MIIHIFYDSAKMKLQYMKNIFHVAHFHMVMVFVLKNISKQVNVTKKLGRFGTGIPTAPVWQSCGKPSTKFPHGGLVDVEPAVNRQPGFRRELVDQITSSIINPWNDLHGNLLKWKIQISTFSFFSKIFIFRSFQNFDISSIWSLHYVFHILSYPY